MRHNFKVGDKVRAIKEGSSFEKGRVYVIERVDDGVFEDYRFAIVNDWGNVCWVLEDAFEVIEEPKQSLLELVKVWEELQKPFEDRKDIEYWEARGAKWIPRVSSRRMLSAELVYRIKPEPQMTWEEFKQELFKLSAIRNVRVVSTEHQVIVTVEYKGIREKTFAYAEYNESDFKQSTIDIIKSHTGVN